MDLLQTISGLEKHSTFSLHQDLNELIWFSDGPAKNYFPLKHKFESAWFSFEYEATKEPSAIRMKLPICVPVAPSSVPPPGYYPSYEELLPEQRWMYLDTLHNPYDSKHDIGYIFILYYGLERYLLSEKYEQAFDVILKLRNVHKNSSFLGYSLMALLVCCAIHDRHDLAEKLQNSIYPTDKISFNITLIIKNMVGEGLSPDELMLFARRFDFINNRYIKSSPNVFKECLQQLLIAEFGSECMPLDSLKCGYIPKTLHVAFANYSLPREIQIPNYLGIPKFKKLGFRLLSDAHDKTKAILAEARKQKKK